VPLLLVRHADAVSRVGWRETDERRPLTKKGREQAHGLVDLFAPYPVAAIWSSPSLRCLQTVLRLAIARGIAVGQTDDLAEGASRRATAFVRSLAGEDAVLVSHGDVIPDLLSVLASHDGLDLGPEPRCQKGSAWVLEPSGERGRFRAAIYFHPVRV
jgi:broad specificity phosphatase PhoE